MKKLLPILLAVIGTAAGIGAGLFDSIEQARATWQEERRFCADPNADVADLRRRWQRAIERA